MVNGIMIAMTICLVLCSITMAKDDPAGSSDIDTLNARYVRSILPTDPEAIQALHRAAAELRESLGDDGSWKDIDYTDQARSIWQARKHTERLLQMSRAHRLAPEPRLLQSILSALDFWILQDFRNPNWWQNEIGTPQLLGTTAILLGENLTDTRKEKLLPILKRSAWVKWTGQNLVWGVTNQIQRGLIERNADTITEGYNRLYQEVRRTSAEGIQHDHSFHQHGPQLYSGGYGLNFAIDAARFAGLSWGTRWQIPQDRMEILTSYLLDGLRWAMHGGRIDYSTVGREITRKGKTAVPRSWARGPVAPIGVAYGLPHTLALLAEHPVPRRDELRSFVASLVGDPGADPLVGNRHFWRSDYHAHHRPGWFASVKMFSTRIINAELVNDEGRKSHHLSDGANLLYLSGGEYTDIFPVWDWTKVPGTTAEQGTLEIEPGRSIGVRGKTSFVGGVSDGRFGLAAMDLLRGPLKARKAWFFFDDGYICLGTGIACTSDNAVATSMNQCLLQGHVSRGDGWVHHAGVGYIFTSRAPVQLTTGEQSGRWSDIGTGSDGLLKRDVFNLWIDHGVKPQDASYVYTILPGATPEQTAAQLANPTVVTIANSPAQQAVWDARAKVLAVAFWEKGSVKWEQHTLAVDRPCLILLNLSQSPGRLAISNPLNEQATITITLDGASTTMELPGGDHAGSSVLAPLPPR